MLIFYGWLLSRYVHAFLAQNYQSAQLKDSSLPDVAQPALQTAPTPPQFVPDSVLLAVSVPEGR